MFFDDPDGVDFEIGVDLDDEPFAQPPDDERLEEDVPAWMYEKEEVLGHAQTDFPCLPVVAV